MVDRKKTAKKSEATEKRGRGRPASGRVRGVTMGVRMNEAERDAITAAAIAAGTTPGAWLLAQGLLNAGQRPK